MYTKVFEILQRKYQVSVLWKHLYPQGNLVGITVDQDAANILG